VSQHVAFPALQLRALRLRRERSLTVAAQYRSHARVLPARVVSSGTREEPSDYPAAAHSVEAALARRRVNDWTAEVMTT
jgi:hypothetical protein